MQQLFIVLFAIALSTKVESQTLLAPCLNGTVRLYSESGSYFRRYGRVQICVNNVWGTVCDDFWDDKDASVICKMLGYSSYGASALFNRFNEGQWNVHIKDLNCTGNEGTIWDCPHNRPINNTCNHYHDVAVVCQSSNVNVTTCKTGEMRLVGGSVHNEGQMEICINGVWGAVCLYSWNSFTANLFCKQLGYHDFGTTLKHSKINPNSVIHVYGAYCDTQHSTFLTCAYQYPQLKYNDYNYYCDIKCESLCTDGFVELYNGVGTMNGLVRYCVNGTWSPLCGDKNSTIDNNLASVICSELGYSPYGAISSKQINDQSNTHHLFNVQCHGHEKQFLECKHETLFNSTCQTTVSVYCQRCTLDRPVNCTDGDVRLYGGSMQNKGILHVCVNRAWSAVCRNNYWTYHDAFVVCHQLGYPGYDTDTTVWTNESYPIMIANLNCLGNETKLNQCDSKIGTYIQGCSYNAVKMKCLSEPCTTGDVRLIGTYYYGRVQVCIGGVWGSICKDRYWDNNDASVICKQLGFSPNGAIIYSYSTLQEQISDPTLLSGLNCTGKEDNIKNCLSDLTASVCSQSQGVGNVICPVHYAPYANCTDGELKLVGGSTSSEGTVQVCFNHAWGTIFGYFYFQKEAVQTICNALGYTKTGATIYRNAHFGRGVGPIFISYLDCSKPEYSIFDCSIDYRHDIINTNYYYYEYVSHSYDVGVKCQDTCQHGNIRLQGSNNPLKGRVEVCIDGTWGTICPNYHWTNKDATVVCRQLGYSEYGAIITTGFWERHKPVHIYDIYCNGTEKKILECRHNTINNPQSCLSYFSDDASVQCQAQSISDNCTEGAVRLMDGQQVPYEGIVEICHQNYWTSICPSGWNDMDATVTCRELGFTVVGARTTLNDFGLGLRPAVFSDFSCTGNENSLLNCSHAQTSCSFSYHAGIKCEVPCTERDVRLVNGHSQVHDYYGRVEVCIGGTWGTVCNNNWDNNDASVVCRQLGYVPHGAIPNNHFYVGYTLSHTIHSVNCKGNESSLLNCSYVINGDNNFNCRDNSFATAICQTNDVVHTNCTDYDVKLVDGNSPNEGKVVVCINGVWGLVCDNSIDLKAAGVMCYQLGYDRDAFIYKAQYSPATNIMFLVYSMSCDGVETSIDECSITHFISTHSCDVHDTTGLRCHSCPDGDIRIIPYRSYPESLGRIEVCVNGTWGTVCSDFFDYSDARVVCRQMGYSPLGSLTVSIFENRVSEYVLPFHIIDLNCNGDENDIWQCPRNNLIQYKCSQSHDAVVGCQIGVQYHNCSDGEVRLSEGISGRLEICFGNVWFGSFCFDVYYDKNFFCRILNYSTQDSKVYTSSFLGLPIIPMLPVEFFCYYGTEQSLSDCYGFLSNCYNNYTSTYLGMECQSLCQDGDIRLAGGSYNNVGRVDLCVRGTWGTICSNSFDNKDASVVCRQLGYSSYGFNIISISSPYYYPVHVSDLACTGDEKTIWDCPYTNINSWYCSRYDDAAVVCQTINVTVDTSCVNGEVRLLGGISDLEGRVEICVNKMWGSVCDYSWDTANANVVCKQLGYQPSGSTAFHNSYFGNGIAPYVISGFGCSGSENSLLLCSQYSLWSDICYGDHKAGVVCLAACNDTSIRLGESSFQNSGRVGFCYKGIWGTICDTTWNFKAAAVICAQLGYSCYGAIATENHHSNLTLATNIDSVNCTGMESSIVECNVVYGGVSSTCKRSADPEVICQNTGITVSNCAHGNIRLVITFSRFNFRQSTEGRVEICINGVWGTICDNGWDIYDANVVCGQLGFFSRGAKPRFSAFYGQGSGPVFLSELNCTGTEHKILECYNDYYAAQSCGHYKDAGIQCLGSFPVLLSSSIGHILGGEPLIITGPTFNPQDIIHCIFDDIQTNGSYLNRQQCLCIVPAATNTGVVDLTVKITRGTTSLYGFTKYRYIIPSLSDYPESVVTSNNTVYVTTGERVRIFWKNIDILPETATVDIILNIYNLDSELWNKNYVISKRLLYSAGQTEVTIPHFDEIDDSTVKIIKISVVLNNNTVIKSFPQVSLNGVAWHTFKFLIKSGIKEISRRLACEIWHNNDNGVNNIRLPPCPCTIEQMRGDDRYIRENLYQFNISKSFFKKFRASICYRQQNILSFSSSQQCCYDSNGRLLTGAGGSTVYSVYPNNWKSLIGHMVSDMTPFYLCCWGAFRSCNYYYARRPSDNCRDWPQRPPPARTFGDPHLVTLDGHKYTFNGHGEFILLQSLDKTLTIQVRMIEPITTYSNQTLVGVGTVVSAIVAKHVDSDAVQFEILNDKLVALVNGDEIDFTNIREQDFKNLTIVNKENRTISGILTNVGVTLTVKENNNFLSDIAITLSDIYHLKTQGLLGQFNGDMNDDLLPKNSNSTLPLNSTNIDIHYQFGLTWIVDHPNMSLFVYGSKGWDYFYKPDFKPIFEVNFTDPKLQEKATEVCGNDQYCLFDMAATGDLSIGEVTKKITEEMKEIEEILMPNVCDPPCIYGACVSNGICFCSIGYEGKSCDTPIYSACEENVCLNGATCQILAGDYFCFCAIGYTGPSCNFTNLTEPTVASTTEESNVGTIVGVTVGATVGTIFLTVVVIATGLLWYFCRFKKKIDTSTVTLISIELDDENISLS